MSSDVHSCGLDGKESCGTRKWLPLGVGLGAFASENIWKCAQQNSNEPNLVADPEFPRGRQPQREGPLIYYLAKYLPKTA